MITDIIDSFVGDLPLNDLAVPRYYGSLALFIICIVAVLYFASLVLKKLLR